jgi:division protein CdvB (Snf7/Vps24/ESCRT-III family)
MLYYSLRIVISHWVQWTVSEYRQKDSHKLQQVIPHVISKLDVSLRKLTNISESLHTEDARLFALCVEAHAKDDHVHAMMYANECAEIRRMALHVMTSSYALEQMVLRLHTVVKLGDVMGTMSPVVSVIQETGNLLEGIVPTIANQLNGANQLLVSSLAHMGTTQLNSQPQNSVVFSDEAATILKEAKNLAVDTVRSQFPSIPSQATEEVKRDIEALTG